jgi:hypothetical protein
MASYFRMRCFVWSYDESCDDVKTAARNIVGVTPFEIKVIQRYIHKTEFEEETKTKR